MSDSIFSRLRPLWTVALAALLCAALPVTSQGEDLYVCTQGGPFGEGHVYRYLGGTSWEKVSAGVNLGQTIMSVETYRGNLVVSTQSASGYGGFSGYGLVWELVGGKWIRTGVIDSSAAVLFVLNEHLYVATSSQRIYRYEDQPGEWTLIAEYAGTGFRAGVVANLRGYEEVFLGELDRDTFFRFGEKDGLKFLADYQRSCVYAMTEHAGAVYSGCWHGSWYRTEDGQYVEQMGIMGRDHVWGMTSFQGKLWIGSGAGRWGDPGRLRSYDGSTLRVVKEFPTTRYAEGVSALSTSPDGKTMYIGLGMTDGYYAGDGNAEIWTYDGTSFTRICEPDFFGGGVQFMRWLKTSRTPCMSARATPSTVAPGGRAVACVKVCGTKLASLKDLEIDLPRCTCKAEEQAPATGEAVTDDLGFSVQITGAVDNGDGTTTITLKLCSGENRHALSHFVIGLPAGKVREMALETATSQRGWPIEAVDPDKKTGLSGIKFDEMVLGEDGKEECEIFTFKIPTDSLTELTVATKAGRYADSTTVAIPKSAAKTESAAKTDELHFTSQITSVADNGDGSTKITLLVCAEEAVTHSLSHLTIALPAAAREMAARTATSDRGWPVSIVDPDPRTGESGIKFDETSLGGDGVKECATVSFDVPTGTVTDLTVATKAGTEVGKVVLVLPNSAGSNSVDRDEPPTLLSVTDHQMYFTIPVCKCAEAGTQQIPIRLTGSSATPEQVISLTVVTEMSAEQQATYDLLQMAICETMALRKNIDDPLISLAIPKAFELAEGGLPATLVSRTVTAQPIQYVKYSATFHRYGSDPSVSTDLYSYPVWYGMVGKELDTYTTSWYESKYEVEYRVGLQADSEVPDNALMVKKVALIFLNGYSMSPASPYKTGLVTMTSSPFPSQGWDEFAASESVWKEMVGADQVVGLERYATQSFDIQTLFGGHGRLKLGLNTQQTDSGSWYAYSGSGWFSGWTAHFVTWGPGRLPRLQMDYLKGYTRTELVRLVLRKLFHDTDGEGAFRAATAFNKRYGKTAAAWGICD